MSNIVKTTNERDGIICFIRIYTIIIICRILYVML